jgi:biotin transport system substrate-specific component
MLSLAGLVEINLPFINYSPLFLVAFLLSQFGDYNYAMIGSTLYLVLGLVGLPLFAYGGGFEYIHINTFGFLIALIPFTWLAFMYRSPDGFKDINYRQLSAFLALHAIGAIYMIVSKKFEVYSFINLSLVQGLVDIILAVLILSLIQKNIIYTKLINTFKWFFNLFKKSKQA